MKANINWRRRITSYNVCYTKLLRNNTAAPTFDNTLVALDKSGALLKKVSYVFFNLSSADTNDSIQAIAKQLSPMLSAHNDDINLNEGLFKRVKAVYTAKERLSLEPDQLRLLDNVITSYSIHYTKLYDR